MMNKISENIKKNMTYLSTVSIVFLLYAVWCLLTISYGGTVFLALSFLGNLLAVGSYYICFRESMVEKYSVPVKKQLLQVEVIILNATLLLFFMEIKEESNAFIILFKIMALLWSVISGMLIFQNIQKNEMKNKILHVIFPMKNKIPLVILIGILLFFAFDPQMLQFKWDGLLYYQSCLDLKVWSISNLALYGHIAQTYGMLVGIVAGIIGNVGYAMAGLNIALLVGGVVAFYGLLQCIVPSKSKWIYTLGSAVYGFSPFFLGMVNYHNLDYYMQCLFPVLLYFTFKKKWILQFIVALLFCFTKETAILVYFFVCVGVVLADFWQMEDRKIIERVKNAVSKKQYYLMMIPGILWFITYQMLGPWTAGDGGLSIDINYMIEKLKVLYILNFNWIFTIGTIIGVCYGIYQKKIRRTNSHIWLPILLAHLSFTAFSCLFKTVNHPRYSDSNMLGIYLVTVVFLIGMKKTWKTVVVGVILNVLMLISCYRTIDPMTKMVFENVDIGSVTMITTGEVPFGDAMIYNKQMLGMEGVIELGIADSIDRGYDIILMPAIEESTYYFDGMAEVHRVDDYIEDTLYWNQKEIKRENLKHQDVIEVRLYHINDKINVEALKIDGDIVTFLYLDGIMDAYVQNIRRQVNVITENTFSLNGWEMHSIQFYL